ncbi:hypothetical protein FHT82_001885 [Rhizobium sp. BK275]|uniref:hypothetical protein n=1 Tax=unclassified Rhizobium TaxID=2613769 RepID=UPI0016162D28|nr:MULTISPECIES: hypothetical protein [unclassified Rhizobium]MBB3389162.1 hypothetical protein [Rhizobium sp. BK275]MBB3408516.1 hypothetical protein [Rhizobium sp. BK316]
MEQAERFRALEGAAMEAAGQGLKALLLLNGGACVALLAFVAGTATSSSLQKEFIPLVTVTAHSLIWFASGAGFAVFACILAYLTNQAYANHLITPEKSKWRTGTWFNVAGLFTAFISLGCFAVGVGAIALALP